MDVHPSDHTAGQRQRHREKDSVCVRTISRRSSRSERERERERVHSIASRFKVSDREGREGKRARARIVRTRRARQIAAAAMRRRRFHQTQRAARRTRRRGRRCRPDAPASARALQLPRPSFSAPHASPSPSRRSFLRVAPVALSLAPPRPSSSVASRLVRAEGDDRVERLDHLEHEVLRAVVRAQVVEPRVGEVASQPQTRRRWTTMDDDGR